MQNVLELIFRCFRRRKKMQKLEGAAFQLFKIIKLKINFHTLDKIFGKANFSDGFLKNGI